MLQHPKADGGQIIKRQPVVAGCDASEVLQPVECILDAPAQPVETLAEAEGLFPVAAIWNDRLGSAPLVLGVRQDRDDAVHRLMVTRVLRGLNLLIFGTHIRDANAPFRLMRTTFLQDALRQFPRDVFAPNILSLVAAKLPFAVAEVPVQHFRRSTGTGSLDLQKLVRICLRCTKELLRFRFGLFHAHGAQEHKSPRDGY